jgi:hypothetical protein
MYQLRFLLRLTSAFFLVHSAANAQTRPFVVDVPGSPPTNNAIVSPPPDASGTPPRPPSEFKILVPDGFGGLKEAPGISDSAPDETGPAARVPNQPFIDPNDSGDH